MIVMGEIKNVKALMYMILQNGADGRSRTATDYVHHPLKMACLPISPRRQLLNYGNSGKSAGVSGAGAVSIISVVTD